MSLTQLIGNEAIKTWLRRGWNAQRLPGALIFAGPSGVGKRSFALALAQALNCQRQTEVQTKVLDSCDQCPACRRIAANQHPDVQLISAEGQFIKVDQVRAAINEIQFRPFEGRWRVQIFDGAEQMREQAANAILKTLEEPPAQALMILVTASPDALLPTIRSRAAQLRFQPLTTAAIEQYLQQNYQRPAKENQLLARLAAGSIGHALSIDLSQYLTEREESLAMLELLARPHQVNGVIKAAEQLGRKERAEFESRLQIVQSLLRDLLCLKVEAQDNLIHQDLINRLQLLAQQLSQQWLIKRSEQLQTVARDLTRNINRQLALEAIFLSGISA